VKRELHVAAGRRRFGPPSVKYRGIFINDEDWGLHFWAARTFDPGRGDIGPKTYAKVFELLLRLIERGKGRLRRRRTCLG